jgi:hypothetical protein
MIGSTRTRAPRRGLRLGALIVTITLAAGGVPFAGAAGAASKGHRCYQDEGMYIKFTKRPKNPTTKRSPTFRYKAFLCFNDQEVSGARFKCKLDDANHYRKCRPPERFHHLDRGKHRLKVKARALGTTGTRAFRWLIT